MKGWQIAALVVGVVLLGVVAFRKVTPAKKATKAVTTPGASNDMFASLLSLGAAVGSKLSAPSSVQLNQGSYVDRGASVSYTDKSSGATDVIQKDYLPETESI